jgi:hypothetical protein
LGTADPVGSTARCTARKDQPPLLSDAEQLVDDDRKRNLLRERSRSALFIGGAFYAIHAARWEEILWRPLEPASPMLRAAIRSLGNNAIEHRRNERVVVRSGSRRGSRPATGDYTYRSLQGCRACYLTGSYLCSGHGDLEQLETDSLLRRRQGGVLPGGGGTPPARDGALISWAGPRWNSIAAGWVGGAGNGAVIPLEPGRHSLRACP